MKKTTVFIWVLLLIELLDEFVYGFAEAAWPLIRDELGLTYIQIGLLLSAPKMIGSFIEPVLGILGDVWKRKVLIVGGGISFTLALVLISNSNSFEVLMLSFVLLFPSSGAFVGLAQATLMDTDPARHEQNMARWTLAGSVGMLCGAAIISIVYDWRVLFMAAALLSLILTIITAYFPFKNGHQAHIESEDDEHQEALTFKQGIKNAITAAKRWEVLRWFTLLEFSDLMLDVFYGYMALYFVDVAGVDPTMVPRAIVLWLGVGLIGDFLIIPLLERVDGLVYLRISVLIVLLLFPAFLLIPNFTAKLVILALLGFFNAGWYSILQGKVYSVMPGQSGTVMTLGNIFGFFGTLVPLGIGAAAQQWGLDIAIWLLWLGPIVLIIGLPSGKHGV